MMEDTAETREQIERTDKAYRDWYARYQSMWDALYRWAKSTEQATGKTCEEIYQDGKL